MKKAVDITERTLEKEKKSFIEACSFWHGACVVLIVLCALTAIVGSLGTGIYSKSLSSVFESVSETATLIMYCISLNFGAAVFKKLKTGESPFRYDIADKIKGAGQVMVWGSIIIIVLETIMNILMGFLDEAGIAKAGEAFNSAVNFPAFFAGGALLMIAYIFNYGCKLQQEADETV